MMALSAATKLRSQIAGLISSAFFLMPGVHAAEFTGYAVLTTDYVYRGVTSSDGHGAAQLGGDVALESGIYFGIWASTIDIDNGPSRLRDTQVNYYAGYAFDLNDRISAGVSVVAYAFPGATGTIDYDYEEYSASVNFRDQVWFEYSFSPDLYTTGYDTHNFDLLGEWPVAWDMTLGAGIGYYDVSELTGQGYSYWQLGISRNLGRIDLDLRYHDTNRWVPIVSTADRADSRVSLSARFQF